MSDNPRPHDEVERLAELRALSVLDTPPESGFDDLVALASRVCDAPVAMVSLIDDDRQWFKASVGTDLRETPRDIAFCAHAVMQPDRPLVVPDATLDPRFRDNPLVTQDPHVRFYAGVPLTTASGRAMGTLCVLDSRPRELSADATEALGTLAREVVGRLELRRATADNARLAEETRQAARRARQAALYDALTGLPNRDAFVERVNGCVARAGLEPAYRYAVLFVDLDRFKVVNDSLGHAAGDLLLNATGRRLGQELAETNVMDYTVARFGGDVFMLLLDNVTGEDAVRAVADTAMAAVGKPFHFGQTVVCPSACVGIVVADAHYASAEDVLRDADAALDRAKARGRASRVTFDVKMHEHAVKRLRVEGDLREAVDRGELLLHYQPVVSLDDSGLVGFEALVRWQHGGRLVSPGDFIPVAEETGLIVPMGRWVLAEAFRQAAEWQRRHAGLPPRRMAVNLSRKQLQDPDLVPLVRKLLWEHALDPAGVMLEITESVIMGDAANARRVLHRLRELGVKLAMDDFGTGYSSLSCLQEFDMDVLKVDRSFVANVNRRREASVLRAVIDLAHTLGMSVVAEGIETVEQMAAVRATSCDFGQGYLFAKPLPAADAGAYLTAAPGLARSA